MCSAHTSQNNRTFNEGRTRHPGELLRKGWGDSWLLISWVLIHAQSLAGMVHICVLGKLRQEDCVSSELAWVRPNEESGRYWV